MWFPRGHDWSKPYTIDLKGKGRIIEKVEFENGNCIYKVLSIPEIEKYSFKTKEEAIAFAKQYGLEEDEYEVIEWKY